MARAVMLIASLCTALASFLFAILAATFDASERTWRPVVAFAGYVLVLPVVLMRNASRTSPTPGVGVYAVTAVCATTVNALIVFATVCGGSLKAYTATHPPRSHQVLTLTCVSAVLFVGVDLLTLAATRRRGGAEANHRDSDSLYVGETQALLGDFGTRDEPSSMRGLGADARAAAESMTAAVRAYDASGERTPEHRASQPGSFALEVGSSPAPVAPSMDKAPRQSPPTAQVLGGSRSMDAPGASSDNVPGTRAKGSEDNIDEDEAAEIELAATLYNESYRERMLGMTAPSEAENAQPFVGFSLTDNVKEGCLVVDGIFEAGPAFQVGVDVDHELISIDGIPVTRMEDVGPLIRKHCHVGHITTFAMRNEKGEPYDAAVWIMTAESRYTGKNYYFDREAHTIRQSDRLKSTWRPSPARRGPSIADEEL